MCMTGLTAAQKFVQTLHCGIRLGVLGGGIAEGDDERLLAVAIYCDLSKCNPIHSCYRPLSTSEQRHVPDMQTRSCYGNRQALAHLGAVPSVTSKTNSCCFHGTQAS